MPRLGFKRGVYAVTDERLVPRGRFFETVEGVLREGVDVLQLRDKTSARAVRLETAKRLAALCRSHETLFIVNDDPSLALEVGAGGVHIGREDGSLEEARRVLGPAAVIGASCSGDVRRAVELAAGGADYVSFGRFFPSRTKPGAPGCPIEVLGQAKEAIRVPIVAIGGINAGNARELFEAGADAVCAAGGIFGERDVRAAVRAIRRLRTRYCP
ncbi:MAG: thiamine phosphate synthase [Elusimicrobiota bacterium]